MPAPPSSTSRSPAIPRWRSASSPRSAIAITGGPIPTATRTARAASPMSSAPSPRPRTTWARRCRSAMRCWRRRASCCRCPKRSARRCCASASSSRRAAMSSPPCRPDQDGYYQVPLLRLNEAGPLILGTVAAQPIPGDPALTLAVPPGATRDCARAAGRLGLGRRGKQSPLLGALARPRAASSSSSRARAAACRSGACCRSAARW